MGAFFLPGRLVFNNLEIEDGCTLHVIMVVVTHLL